MQATKIKWTTTSPEQTMQKGRQIAKHLKGGEIICLIGGLGSGKTTFVKGLAQGLGIDPNEVNSPTFVLMNVYEGKRALFHFDLYRIEEAGEIVNLGYEEFLYSKGVAVIEWADHFGDLMPREYLKINFSPRKKEERMISLIGRGEQYQRFMKRLQ